ncbi:MAG TPA: hypothetical protein VFM18_07600 [Methanosarcina sp.]|nr:hypothetical protein [Methanosarcina sp.]
MPPRAIETQESTGPVRVVLHNVISPDLPTFKDKLLHLKSVQDSFRDPNLLWVAEPHIGHAAIQKLIEHTKKHGREGVVIASLTRPEASNFRVKIKHQDHYNLLVTRILQEYDTKGNPKQSMGSLELSDKSGRVVGNVGTGFTPALRREIWNNKDEWLGKLIQINTMGLARHRLRMPVYNGEADGELDLVE